MELCSPSMSETGGSLCPVKQLPCHSVPLRRLQTSGHHAHNGVHLAQQPWVSHASPAVASGPPVVVRHRVNVAPSGNPESAVSRQKGELDCCVPKRKVVVTGGGGYFGFKLGKHLASEGFSVIFLDLNKPPCDIPSGAIFHQVWLKYVLYIICYTYYHFWFYFFFLHLIYLSNFDPQEMKDS